MQHKEAQLDDKSMTIQWYIYQKLDLLYILPLVTNKGHIYSMVACMLFCIC